MSLVDAGPGLGTALGTDAVLAERIRDVTVRLARRMRQDGPAPLRRAVLGELAGGESLRQSELVLRVGVAAPTISRVVADLVEAGLVEQRADADARHRRVTLSASGRAALGTGPAPEVEWLRWRLARLGVGERRTVLDAIGLLEQLAEG